VNVASFSINVLGNTGFGTYIIPVMIEMDSSELLRLRLANALYCRQQNICGEVMASTPVLKSFTIFMNYSSAISLSSVYIPPGLFGPNADPSLPGGGIFTGNVGSDLVFLDGSSITLNNTTYAFVNSMAAAGCVQSVAFTSPPTTIAKWQPVANVNMTFIGGIYYSITTPNSIVVSGLELARLNGANLSLTTTTGPGAGFLASITLFYI
jgi:hypothetical protein